MAEDNTQAAPQGLDAYLKLRRRHRRFVELIVEGHTGTEAMRRCNFKGRRPDVAAAKLLAKEEVRAAVREYDAFTTAQAMERRYRTIRQIEFIATFDQRRLYGDDGELLAVTEWPDDVAAVVSSMEVEELFEGTGKERTCIGKLKKVKTWSKGEALRLLAQIQKLVVEKHEHAGPDGRPLAPPIINIGFANGGPGQPSPSTEGS